MKSKLSSRKFWMAAAAFLGSVGVGIAGLAIGNYDLTTIGVIFSVISAGIYEAIEAMVDVDRH